MWILLTIAGIIVLLFLILAVAVIHHRLTKTFSRGLKPLERRIFLELENELKETVGPLITQQLTFLKSGARLYFKKSYVLDLYESKGRLIPAEIRFEEKRECKLATVWFYYRDTKYKVEYNAAGGRVTDLTVRPSPKRILRKGSVRFENFKLVNDVSKKLDTTVVREFFEEGASFGGGLLGALGSKHVLTRIYKPLLPAQQQVFIKLAATKFPSDYLALLTETNGFSIGELEVVGFGELQSVSLESASYLKLAEKPGGWLAIRQSRRSTQLQYLSLEDMDDVRDLGKEFLPALEAFIGME